MDLRSALLRAAVGRPHVLVIGGIGTDRLRARVEQEVARRRWPPASAPADADLVVVGQPGRELGPVVDDVWAGVPAPRALLRIRDDAEVVAALDAALRRLADAATRRSAAPRDGRATRHPEASPAGRDHADGEPDEHVNDGQDGARDGGDGHDHHGGGMELPGGLDMADLGEDRDGLALDRLHVTLGPVLPDWPSGLVVDVTLQGDVIQDARARFLDQEGHRDHATTSLPDAARALEAAARVLALAGWAGPAARARDVRDTVLFGDGGTDRVVDEIDALHRRVRRSRTLRWMLRSAGAGRPELPEALDEKLVHARAAVRDVATEPAAADPTDLAALDARLVGAELATARLIVAVADPSPRLAPTQPSERSGAS